MSVPPVQPQISLMKRLVGVVRESVSGLNTGGGSWRKPSAIAGPDLRGHSDGLSVSTAGVMPKRARGIGTSDEARQDGIESITACGKTSARASPDDLLDVRITSGIIEEMQKLAKYRLKIEKLHRRKSRIEQLAATREQVLSRLEHEVDQLASAEVSPSEATGETEKALEEARILYDESAHHIDLLEKRIGVFELNVAFARETVEDELGHLLSGRGLFEAAVTETESSHCSSTRSSKRPRMEDDTIYRPSESDPDADKKQAALAKLHETEAQYREAQHRFGNRSELYKDMLQEWQQHNAAGEYGMTRTGFDVEFCILYGDLGIDVIEAEANRSKAALNVMRLNARPITQSQTSKFADHPADAEGLLKEAEHAIQTLDVSKVQSWLQSVEEDEPAEQHVEVDADEWEARSLRYGESCNGVAEPWTKLRLKRWDAARQARWVAMREELQRTAVLPDDGSGQRRASTFVIEVDPTTTEVPALISEMQG
jgi:hypothetical protein